MIALSKGNLHDINHFLMVWAYARNIGLMEALDQRTQDILEIAALVHDIACPLCREKYGSTAGKLQEQEGATLTEHFLKEYDIDEEMKNRICYLIGHHHTFTQIEGMDYQILIEADYLVNAIENGWGKDNVSNFVSKFFKTSAGIGLAKNLFLEY